MTRTQERNRMQRIPALQIVWKKISNSRRMDVCTVVLSHRGYCMSRMGKPSVHQGVVDSPSY